MKFTITEPKSEIPIVYDNLSRITVTTDKAPLNSNPTSSGLAIVIMLYDKKGENRLGQGWLTFDPSLKTTFEINEET